MSASGSPARPPRASLVARGALPLLTFAIALLVTGLLVVNVADTIRRQDRLAFETEVSRSLDAIRERTDTVVTLLHGTAGLFAASDEVSLREFRIYVDKLGLRERYPGILGVGFSRAIAADEVEAIEAWMREEGIADFRVWPDEPRNAYHSILYLEPLDERNRAAIGYDMYTNPVRREAMAAARATGQPVASGRVTLVQEIDERKQAGFLIYTPVYANNPAEMQLPPPQRTLLGFAYAPLRADDLLESVRGSGVKLIDVAIYDGPEPLPGHRLRSTMTAGHEPRFTVDHLLEVGGRNWLVRFASRPEADALSQQWLVRWMALAAFASSLLLAWISASQLRAYRTAERTAQAQRAAADALHREREWLSGTLTSIGDGVIAIDDEDRVIMMNPVAERLTGWSNGDARGRPLAEVAVVGDRPDGDHAAPGEHGRGEILLRARDGQVRPIDHSSAPIRDPSGRASGAVIVMRDATERYTVEAELRANDRRKDEFLAMLAHELRNPLAPICNSLELMRRRPDGELAERAREVAARQAQHMVRLIDDLLDLSRISRGKIELRRRPMRLAAALDAAIESSRPLIEEQRHTLQLGPIDPDLCIDGDQTRLAQVFANLLNNAATYTEPGGRIELSVRRVEDAVEVVVSDNGIGIDAAHLPHVFDMFVQANRSLDRSGGLGIGLTLVRNLVQMHGGSVEVHSQGAGTGSRFVVRLPLIDPAQHGLPPLAHEDAAAPSPTPAPAPADAAHRVLVVDDNRDAADSLALMLELDGYAVSVAYDGHSGLQQALTDAPHVTLLDIGLPGLSGYDVARQIRDRWGDGPCLIAITGWGQDRDRERTRAAGFNHHLVKPIDYDALVGLLPRQG